MSDDHFGLDPTFADDVGDGPVLPALGERRRCREMLEHLRPPHPCVPDGPLDADPGGPPVLPETRRQALVSVLSGVPLGALDVRVLGWLSGLDDPVCQVVASLIWRARQAGAATARGEGADQDDDDLDDVVPYCTVCGENVALFHGMTGWQHFRGEHAPGSHRELFEASHETEVAWRQANPGAVGRAVRP